MQNETSKSGYSSRFGLICVLIAASVGTGNIWRFPRLVASYGGAFIVIMMIFTIILMIPLGYVENVMGRASRHGAPGAFRDMLGEKFTWLGSFNMVVYFLMLCYYMVVCGWTLRYAVLSVTGGYYGVDKAELFNIESNGSVGMIICWLVCLVLLYFCVTKQSTLEAATKIMVPSLAVILIALMVYALTREGSVEGLKYSFSMKVSDFTNPSIWLDAITQAIWSMGPGTYIIIASSKYTAKNEDIALNTHLQCYGDMSFAVLGAMMILPCVFALSPSNEAAIEACASGNNGLTFIALTGLFETLGGAGRVVGTLFFIALFVAAFSSAIVMITPFTNHLIDTGMTRKKANTLATLGLLIIGIPSVLSQDFLTNQDNVWGIGLFFGGLFISIAGNVIGPEKLREKFINPVSDIKIGKSFDILIRIAPFIFGVIILAWTIQSIGWDPQWWSLFSTSSFGTMFYQWAVVFIFVFVFNKKIARSIKKRYYNGESFEELSEEISNEK